MRFVPLSVIWLFEFMAADVMTGAAYADAAKRKIKAVNDDTRNKIFHLEAPP